MARTWKQRFDRLARKHKDTAIAYKILWRDYWRIMEDRTHLVERLRELQGEAIRTRAEEEMKRKEEGVTVH